MAIRCVYTDLDGTLLGRGASLFRDADGAFTLLAARALEACSRAGAEVVLKSGRRKAQVMEDARLLGQTSYIYEVGCGIVIDGEEEYLTGDLQPGDGKTVHQLIEESGAPQLLLDTYRGREGPPHAYHLIPKVASKAAAVARHMRARGYAPGECNAVGDSREDLGVAEHVGRFFLVANALDRDPAITNGAAANVEVTEGRNGEGFYEAVIRSLAEGR